MSNPRKGRKGAEELVRSSVAAEMLHVPRSTIRRLERQGILRAVRKEGKKSWYNVRDLSAAAEALSQEVTPSSATHLASRAFVAARRAERKLDLIMGLYGLRYEPLDTSEEAILEEHAVARKYASGDLTHVGSEEAFAWAKRLLRMNREYLAMLCFTLVEETDPWATFLDAADRVLGALSVRRAEIGIQLACDVLDHARRHLVQEAYVYCRLKDGKKAADAAFPDTQRSDVNDIVALFL